MHCVGLEGGEDAQACWLAYDELSERKRRANACLESRGTQGFVEEMDHLEQMARELMGMPSRLVRTLHALASSRRTMYEESTTEADWDLIETRSRAERVFRELDRNGDGVIDPAEFREGMHLLGEDLDGEQVQMVFRALETDGFLRLEEFVLIAETASDMSHESRHTHALRSFHLKPSWWSE